MKDPGKHPDLVIVDEIKYQCPHCHTPLTPSEIARLMGQITSEAKAKASRNNGARNDGSKSTGRPPGSKDKQPRKKHKAA